MRSCVPARAAIARGSTPAATDGSAPTVTVPRRWVDRSRACCSTAATSSEMRSNGADQLAPGLGQRHPPVVAIEEADAKGRFELADLHGEGRLRDVQRAPRLVKCPSRATARNASMCRSSAVIASFGTLPSE